MSTYYLATIVSNRTVTKTSWMVITQLTLFLLLTFRSIMSCDEDLISVDYEIFGRVQGVFFRKYTQAEAKKLGLVGWVQNTDEGTVQGQMQGPSCKVKQMQEWLRSTGSPSSKITKAEFKNEKKIQALDHSTFKIVR